MRLPVHGKEGRVEAYTQVDDELHESLAKIHWRLVGKGYAASDIGGRKDVRRTYLHRMILGLSVGDHLIADHINGDKLDNRRANLRVLNRKTSAQNVSGRNRYRGVTKSGDLWIAQAKKDGRHIYLGRYMTEQGAAIIAAKWRKENFAYAVEDDELLAMPSPQAYVRPTKVCAICTSAAVCRGLCASHYRKKYQAENRVRLRIYARQYYAKTRGGSKR